MGDLIKILDRSSAAEAIKNLCEDDLRFLNRLIIDRINFLNHSKCQDQLCRFYIGDRVRFQTPAGEEKTGTVIRVNQKTLSVTTGDNGGWWKLSPGLVKKVDN